MWLCSQAAPFVCGDTGSIRDLEHVLWEIPLTILVQLVHWKICANGNWTIPPPPPAAAEAERVLAAAALTGVQM